jgi:hypothetical protein
MSMTNGLQKPSPQGERFIALARRIDVEKPDETFDRKFDEITQVRPRRAKPPRLATRPAR